MPASNLSRLLKFDLQSYHDVRELFCLPAVPEHFCKVRKGLRGAGQVGLFGDLDLIVGVDEVGRGCLAGPVVSAAVLLPLDRLDRTFMQALAHLDDSKKLSPDIREELAAYIRANCRYAIGQASAAEIDEINILNASLLSMRRAVEDLCVSAAVKETLVMVDGNKQIKELTRHQLTVVQGDGRSASIAAASVVAKVHRDALMRELALLYPVYGFASHKGYGSLSHRRAIAEHGPCLEHRTTFKFTCEPAN